MSNSDLLQPLYRTYITACHILHHYSVLDAYGHLSVRHPHDPSVFIMARYLPPALISSPSDLLEYQVSNAEPVDPHAPQGYTERFIHSEVYKQFPDAGAVVHSHSNAVIPFGIVAKAEMRACTNTAGFLGTTTPVFDARQHFREGDIKDHLIRSEHLGAALASHFTNSSSGSSLDRSVVLMRGHGMTVAASTIEHCVFRAIYAQNNAQVQTTALLLSSSLSVGARAGAGRNDVEPPITYLDDEEIADSIKINTKTALRPWRSWAREAEASPLYVNLA